MLSKTKAVYYRVNRDSYCLEDEEDEMKRRIVGADNHARAT